MDPSGHDVFIPGLGNVEDINSITLDQWDSIIYSGHYYETMALLEGYEYMRETIPSQAYDLENGEEYYYLCWYEDDEALSIIDSRFDADSGEIRINSRLAEANIHSISQAILEASYQIKPVGFFPDLSDFPTSDQALIAYDIAAVTGDAVSIGGTLTGNPAVAGVGYWSSNVASVNGFVETWNMYNTGRATGWDLIVSGTTTFFGFFPWVGGGASIFQLWWDTNH